MNGRWLAALLSLIAGCGSGPPDGASRSGSRLEARVLRLPGAPDWFADFYDTERDEACSFARAKDGEVRCLPSSVHADLRCGAADAGVGESSDGGPTSADFVRGEVHDVVEPGERLGVLAVRGDDGSAGPVTAYDSRLEAACWPCGSAGADCPCEVIDAWITFGSPDARCLGEPIRFAEVRECGWSTPSAAADSIGCRAILGRREDTLYTNANGCTPRRPAGVEYHDVGPLQNDCTTATQEVRALGTGRLRPYFVLTSQGDALVPAVREYLWDEERGENCRLVPYSRTHWACVGSEVREVKLYYADAACAQLVGVAPDRSFLQEGTPVFAPATRQAEGEALSKPSLHVVTGVGTGSLYTPTTSAATACWQVEGYATYAFLEPAPPEAAQRVKLVELSAGKVPPPAR